MLSENYYIIKTDVAKYFNSIDKKILLEILERKIKDPKLIWLIKEILYAQKRAKGIEIGNYTSQIFANIYLNEVDQYVKHELKVKYYVRYLDDSILIVQTKEEAKKVLQLVRKFLKEKLELELNNKTQIFKGKQGVNFCGYKIQKYISSNIEKVRKKQMKYLYMNEQERQDFGNARGVRNLFEKMIVNQANRLVTLEEPTREQLMTLTEADV